MQHDIRRPSSTLHILRLVILGLGKVLLLGVPAVKALPFPFSAQNHAEPEAGETDTWILYIVAVALVLLGGAFAGLTIALMGQDGTYLLVISEDAEDPQHRNARCVYNLLTKGKHWVLVTLLLSNVIVNETLPVVLDRCFGGGVAAVVGSTVLIVIFGEVIPQSLCVRYGLQIGGYMAKPVLWMMYIMAPVAWPTAKLLDWLLGEDHGTVYKKRGLKTLVLLHKSLGEVDERLNQDEVTIISAVLDLKRKPVEKVMTPMNDVYIMSEDTVLDEKTIDQILDAGYSRIPIHQTGNPNNFVGMLLVKILITYDPEDCKRVREFTLATLPETRPETSCLDIINFFQEGKSHMVLISEFPGEDHGALGVVTLEDVIEELIGEEIIDESDVYVDVHKAIRRTHPAPKTRLQRKDLRPREASFKADRLIDLDETQDVRPRDIRKASLSAGNDALAAMSCSPKTTTLLMRRSSAGQDGQVVHTTVPVKANYQDIKGHLKHLGPSNRASNPKSTKVTAVKIKPGQQFRQDVEILIPASELESLTQLDETAAESTSLLQAHKLTVKDGVQGLQQSYGSLHGSASGESPPIRPLSLAGDIDGYTPQEIDGVAQSADHTAAANSSSTEDSVGDSNSITQRGEGFRSRNRATRGYVRSGSITENVVEAGGIRKVVLEANSSSEDEVGLMVQGSSCGPSATGSLHSDDATEDGVVATSYRATGKKNRRKKQRNDV